MQIIYFAGILLINMAKGISIIICCYNSEKRIVPTLDHLKKQNCPKEISWEVLVIDNASTDNTAQVAKDCWGDYPIPLKVIREDKAGLSFARETGFSNSAYDLVCLVDDDNWVIPDWITTIFYTMEKNPKIGACGGRGEGVFECEPPFWFENTSMLMLLALN
ncbi:MAG: glycosyltransferase family 2 protein [Chloroflexia bacterium]|nr:glycosyltransferase family 2 protein [Chloroflexia bacterium]